MAGTLPSRPPHTLTPKQELFAIEYAKDFNATQAAIRAGYSKRTAYSQGGRLLKKVSALVEKRLTLAKGEAEKTVPESIQRQNRGIATLEQSLRLATALAFGDPRKLFDEHHNCKSLPELTRAQALVVAGFEVEENFTKIGDKAEHTGYTKRYRMVDRAPYVNMLLKFYGAFPKDRPQAPPTARRGFDLSKLTDEELKEHMRLRKKAMVQIEDQS